MTPPTLQSLICLEGIINKMWTRWTSEQWAGVNISTATLAGDPERLCGRPVNKSEERIINNIDIWTCPFSVPSALLSSVIGYYSWVIMCIASFNWNHQCSHQLRYHMAYRNRYGSLVLSPGRRICLSSMPWGFIHFISCLIVSWDTAYPPAIAIISSPIARRFTLHECSYTFE